MNTLIDPLKRIARDLVDKKLWPVAVLLLAALVAVPMLIGGSPAEEAPAPAALAATAPEGPGSKSLVTVVDQAVTGKDSRPGRVDDPFYDPPEPPAVDTGAASAPAATATTEASKEGGTPAGEGTSDETTPQPAEPAVDHVYYRTEVRWYADKLSKLRPLSRLTPLGGETDTAILYLGVTKSSGNYAVFLLGANATSDGEAKCEDTDCRVIGLKSGESQIVTVQSADGGEARQYHLEVVRVKRVATDAATARTLRLRVHPDGRDAMRAMWQHEPNATALRPIQYDRDAGLLVKQAETAGDVAATGAAQPAE